MAVSMIANKLPQQATWWSVTAGDGFGGDVVAPPVLLNCRWQDVSETMRSHLDSREFVSRAVVYLDTDIAVGDYLCLGDQTVQTDPATVNGAWKVERWNKTPDLRNLDFVRKAVL